MNRNLLRLLLLNALFILLICLTAFDGWSILANNVENIVEFLGGVILFVGIYGIIMAIPAFILWAGIEWLAPSGTKNSYGKVFLGFSIGGLLMIALETGLSALISHGHPNPWVYIVFWLFGATASGIMGHFYKRSSKMGTFDEVEAEVVF